ncbi:S-layer homology domain-containing protein [Paenibacillus sp. RC67]|uniref:S-layer homology domain-containing protein n=1 Tax=Paenibacillus sp. RC67 TaxID=3039392 RepID=UPI0024ADADDB|nr:S-layer homology domain-containing protein [Paenibacillus sp. RC67]
MSRRAILSLLLGMSLTLIYAGVGYAESVESKLPLRSKEEIIGRWKMYSPDNYKVNPFTETPRITDVYAPGKVNIRYLEGGVARANFYRFISGLPDNLELSEDLSDRIQYGAVVTSAVYGNLNHVVAKPADMNDEFFEKASNALKKSSSVAIKETSPNLLAASVDMYMNSSLDGNSINRYGNNLDLLKPYMKKIGFGIAPGIQNTQTFYSSMSFTDDVSPEPIDYSFVPYPAQGNFPADVFKPSNKWTILLNPYQFIHDSKDIVIQLTRQTDQRTWSSKNAWNSNHIRVSNFKDFSQIDFIPEELDSIKDNDVFSVKVTGLKSYTGFETEINYNINFFYINKPVSESKTETSSPVSTISNINDPLPGEKAVPISNGNAQIPPASDIRFSDIAGHWSESTVQWGITNGIVDGYTDGKFKPDSQVSEEEFLSMLFKVFDQKANSTSGAAWSDSLYAFAVQHKYPVKGVENRAARSQLITRESMAEIIAAADGAPLLKDKAIDYLLSKSYAEGRSNESGIAGFSGQEGLTRAEALQLIRNVKEHGMSTLQ